MFCGASGFFTVSQNFVAGGRLGRIHCDLTRSGRPASFAGKPQWLKLILLTVLARKSAVQTLDPSKSTAWGPLPTGRVRWTAPLPRRSLIIVASVSFAT